MNFIVNNKLLLKRVILLIAFQLLFAISSYALGNPNKSLGIAVGSQYDSTHVYVAPSDLDNFVNSFVATFGGQPSKPIISNVTPVSSSTTFRYIMSPVG